MGEQLSTPVVVVGERSTGVGVGRDVEADEPELALGSGPDGLALTRKILAGAESFLEPHGLLLVEVGNSWPALEENYPRLPFTWIEFEHGGHGVFLFTKAELLEYF